MLIRFTAEIAFLRYICNVDRNSQGVVCSMLKQCLQLFV